MGLLTPASSAPLSAQVSALPVELYRAEYTATATTTSTAADGDAFAPAWGGSFTVRAEKPNVEINVYVPYAYATVTGILRLVLMFDGVNAGTANWYVIVAGSGGVLVGKWIRTGLSAGTHTVAMNKKIDSAGTATYLMGGGNNGVLQVREL